MQHKTEYTRYLKITDHYGYTSTYEVNKTYLCDMKKANACQVRAQWYGYEEIGPRRYTLYRCPHHGLIRVRI
jgi:hypothetical protein